MKRISYGLIGLVAVLALPAAAENAAFEATLVELAVTYQQPDPFQPWQMNTPASRRGLGTIIDDGLIVTTAQLVRNHTLVELRKVRDGRKFTATLVQVDEQVGLALLSIDQPEDFGLMQPLPVATNGLPDGPLTLVQIDSTHQIQLGEGEIVKVSVEKLKSAAYSCLNYSVLSDLHIRSSGGPVVKDGQLAGLVIEYRSAERTAVVLPAPFVHRFIRDAESAPYTGFGSAGFRWRELIDPVKRRYLGVAPNSGGVLVLSVMPGTGAAEALAPGDVILEWDGHTLDDRGYYDDSIYGRVLFSHLIKLGRLPGAQAPAKIVRRRETKTVDVPILRTDENMALVPENTARRPANYLVEGGFIIRELTAHYLRSYGRDWRARANSRLVSHYYGRIKKEFEPGERVVMLVGVLPDPINVGYHHFSGEVVVRANGKPIKNLNDIFAIRDADEGLTSFGFQSSTFDITIDRNMLEEANQRLSQAYRIPSLERRSP